MKVISLQQTINLYYNHKIHQVSYILHLLTLVITDAVIAVEVVSHWQHFRIALLCTISMEHLNILLMQSALLNQVRASRRSAHAWFLKIDPVWIMSMCVCVCVSAPKAINN